MMNAISPEPRNGKNWFYAMNSKSGVWSFVLLVALGLLLFWLRDLQVQQSDADASTLARTARVVDDSSSAEHRRAARLKGSGRTMPEGPITTHEPAQLKDFYLLECYGHRVSIHTALKLLDEAYQDACYFSLEKPLKLQYAVEGQNDKKISFKIKGKKWLDALNYIATLAGMEVNHDGLQVRLVPLELKPESSVVILSPFLREQLLQDLIDAGDWEAHAEKPDVATLLRLCGLVTDAVISEHGASGLISIDGTNHELAAVWAMLSMEEANSEMLSIQSKILTSQKSLDLPQSGLDQEGMNEWIMNLMEREEVTVVSNPSVTARSGQQAMIEIKEEQGEDWTGMQLAFQPEPIGLKLSASNLTEIRPADEKLDDQRKEAEFLVYDGDTQVKAIGQDGGGFYYQSTSISVVPKYNEITSQSMDQILNNPNRMANAVYPVARAVPGKEGYVFSPSNGSFIDVRDIPSGTLVADPSFPMSEKKFFRVP